MIGIPAPPLWIVAMLKALAAPFRWLWQWLMADWRHPIMLALAVICVMHIALIEPRLRSTIADLSADLTAEKDAHSATVRNYREAAKKAAAAQAENLARVQAEQAAITERTVDEYQARIADARARADELRRRSAAAADPGSSGETGLPGTGAAAGGADRATEDNRLPSFIGQCSGTLTLDERLIATEQAIQLDALIDWLIAQSSVRTSPEPVRD